MDLSTHVLFVEKFFRKSLINGKNLNLGGHFNYIMLSFLSLLLLLLTHTKVATSSRLPPMGNVSIESAIASLTRNNDDIPVPRMTSTFGRQGVLLLEQFWQLTDLADCLREYRLSPGGFGEVGPKAECASQTDGGEMYGCVEFVQGAQVLRESKFKYHSLEGLYL